jgi:cytosine/adenosine deaminase-related metal-dependent hydrolase
MGLADRGEIAVGRRADLVLVDWPDGHAPAIRGTWVAGRAAYLGRPPGRARQTPPHSTSKETDHAPSAEDRRLSEAR